MMLYVHTNTSISTSEDNFCVTCFNLPLDDSIVSSTKYPPDGEAFALGVNIAGLVVVVVVVVVVAVLDVVVDDNAVAVV